MKMAHQLNTENLAIFTVLLSLLMGKNGQALNITSKASNSQVTPCYHNIPPYSLGVDEEYLEKVRTSATPGESKRLARLDTAKRRDDW